MVLVGPRAAGQGCQLRECQAVASVSVPWGWQCPGAHTATAPKGCPVKGPLSSEPEARGAQGWNSQQVTQEDEEGSVPPSKVAPASPKHSGSRAGCKPWHSSPASASLHSLCLAPIKHHGLRSPSGGSRDKRLGQHKLSALRPGRALAKCCRGRTLLLAPTCPAWGHSTAREQSKLQQAGNNSHPHVHIVPTLLLHLPSCAHHTYWLGLEESKSLLDLMLALPNAFHTSSHLLAHLYVLNPHHILALYEIPRKLCLQLCLGDVPGWKGVTCYNACSIQR